MNWKFNDGDAELFNWVDSDWKGEDDIVCTVIRKLTNDEADLVETGPMYKVKLEGKRGIVFDAFEYELTATE